MTIDDVRGELFEAVSQPLAVAAVVLLAGIHAAVWMLVFERMGYPRLLAALLFIPPFTLFMPIALALTRWPAQEALGPTRFRKLGKRPAQRFVRRARPAGASVPPPPESFGGRRPLVLAEDGLPRTRIALEPSHHEPSHIEPAQEDTLFRPLGGASAFHPSTPHQPSWYPR